MYGYGGGFGGYGGGFGGGAPWCPRVAAPVAPVRNYGAGFALIVVLFILLIIVGAAACF